MRHRDLLLHTTILCGLALLPGAALANPMGGSVAGGSAAISSSGSTLTVNQSSARAIIDWNSFDISSGETTKFVQPSSSAIALNRISENKPSQINGTLSANGNIILVNPDGVVFGAGSQVNVNSLVVTSSDIDDNAFMNGGKLLFGAPGNANAQIINQGQITVADAGLVGLVAPYVENQGVITARLGKVQLASGNGFTLDMAGDGITQVAVSRALAQQLVSNSGMILADGGTIELTAAAAADIVNALVVNTGEIRADTIGQSNGRIVLSAASGTVTNSGSLSARGLNSGQSGGNVSIAASHVQQQGTINVSGQQNGGSVNIDFAQDYADTPTSSILANGVQGNGGSINLIGTAGNGSALDASGTYEATSQFGKGGTISLFADAINLTGVKLNVSGATGGQIAVGTATSQKVTTDSAATLKADATQGTGGSITVQGAAVTMDGSASAQGETQGGTITVTFDNSYLDTADTLLTVTGSQGNGGTVSVTGGNNASLSASGSYIADGNSDGGTIAMLTQQGNILLLGTYLSSRGPLGGGTVRIGGDFIYAGELVGWNAGTITNSYATGAVSGDSSAESIGGLVGENYYGTISGSYATGAVSGGYFVGGLAGDNDGTIGTSYATGAVNGTDAQAGGLVGYNDGTIANSYATGAVSGGFDPGGLVGQNDGAVSNSYATGAVSGDGQTSSIGGLVGYDSGTGIYTNDFWDTETSGQSTSAGGTGKTTAEMQNSSTFSSWSIDGNYTGSSTAWYIIDGSSYPILRSPAADMPALTWTGATSTAWNTASNWNLDAVPTSANSAIIADVSNEPVLDIDAAINNLTLDSGSMLDLNNHTLTVGGTLTGTNATITSSTGDLKLITDGLALDSASKLSGGGQLIIAPLNATDTIGVNGGSGTLQITSTDLSDIQSGFAGITIGGGNGYSGNIAVNDYSWNAPITYANGSGNVTVTNSSGAITVDENLTTTGSGSLTLSAYSNIVVNAAITLAGGNLILDADNHATGSGYITVNGAITSNGGNITLGGGEANPANIIAGTGYATGNNAYGTNYGVYIASVDAGGGNVIVNGQGGSYSVGYNCGIYIADNITTSGSGAITLHFP